MEIDYSKLAEIGINAFQIHWQVFDNNNKFYSGELEASSEEDAFELGRFLYGHCHKLLFNSWKVTIHNKLTKKWVHEWDSMKQRVAPPNHKVFIVVGGRDCDGFDWCAYYSFQTLEEANQTINEVLDSVDGPTGYRTLSVDDWEEGEYPAYRDRYGEAMGY